MPAVPVLVSTDISAQSSWAGVSVSVGEDGYGGSALDFAALPGCFSSKRARRAPAKRGCRWDCVGTEAFGREIIIPDCWVDQVMFVSRLLETWFGCGVVVSFRVVGGGDGDGEI